jgi:hypothetical protein
MLFLWSSIGPFIHKDTVAQTICIVKMNYSGGPGLFGGTRRWRLAADDVGQFFHDLGWHGVSPVTLGSARFH